MDNPGWLSWRNGSGWFQSREWSIPSVCLFGLSLGPPNPDIQKVKNLEPHIGVSIVHPIMLENGWEFRTDFSQCTGDQILGKNSIFEVYLAADKNITSRASVPILWDVKQATIVSNEI